MRYEQDIIHTEVDVLKLLGDTVKIQYLAHWDLHEGNVIVKDGKCRRAIYDVYFYLIAVMESYYREYSPEHRNGVTQLLQMALNQLEKL